MTDWTLRVTIAAPEAMRDDANELSMVLGQGPADGLTFSEAQYQDADGNLYAVASTLARNSFPSAATSTLERPAWDGEPYVVNMAGANRAQAALVVYNPEAPVQAAPSHMLAVIYPDAKDALAIMELTQVQDDPL